MVTICLHCHMRLDSVDWNGGMEQWNGTVEWNGGMHAWNSYSVHVCWSVASGSCIIAIFMRAQTETERIIVC